MVKDGSKFNPYQVRVTRWKDSTVKHVEFYYNPEFQST